MRPDPQPTGASRLACGCHGNRREDGSYVVIDGCRLGHMCSHAPGDVVTLDENRRAAVVNAEWDRAEADYLEQR